MTITSHLLEAYLKCPTKCWLRSAGEQVTDSSYAQCIRAENDLFCTAQIHRLLSGTHESECMITPSADDLKPGKWRLAIGVLAQTPHLEPHLHAVEHQPSEGRGKPALFIAIRFLPTNKVTKDAKLLLAFDTLVLSELRRAAGELGASNHRRSDSQPEPKYRQVGRGHRQGRPEAGRTQESNQHQGDRRVEQRSSAVDHRRYLRLRR